MSPHKILSTFNHSKHKLSLASHLPKEAALYSRSIDTFTKGLNDVLGQTVTIQSARGNLGNAPGSPETEAALQRISAIAC